MWSSVVMGNAISLHLCAQPLPLFLAAANRNEDLQCLASTSLKAPNGSQERLSTLHKTWSGRGSVRTRILQVG